MPSGEPTGTIASPTVIDELGIVVSCAVTDYITPVVGDISVSNPFDINGLEVVWAARPCIEIVSLTLRLSDDGYELAGLARCSSDIVGTSGALYLNLSEPLPAEAINSYLHAAPGEPPLPTPALPPPVTPDPSANHDLSPRQRIDRFWESFGNVGCIGLGAPDEIETVVRWADLIVIGRPTGAQTWDDSPYPVSDSLVSFKVSQVIKGPPSIQPGDFVQFVGTEVPSASIDDIDHLLFLNVDSRDARVYYLTDDFASVFANVAGRVVTAEYAAIKDAYGHRLYPTDLDGTSFDDLVSRIRSATQEDAVTMKLLARRGYFAC